MFLASWRGVQCHHNAVEERGIRRRKPDRKGLSAGSINEYSMWLTAKPALRPVDLVGRSLDRTPEPSFPIKSNVSSVRKGARLVGKDDDVFIEDDQNVAKLFAKTFPTTSALIAVNVGIAPKT